MAAAAPTVTVNDWTIIGKAQAPTENCPRPLDIFYGIPYASAPRFASPVPMPLGSSSTGTMSTMDASKPGPGCPAVMAQHATAESPLRLNIFRPARSGSGSGSPLLLPVALYFHGGAFNFGNALDSAMDSFVSHEGGGPAGHRDVMVVTAAYRLGALGFLNGEGECNLGLKDQRAAVRWVADWAREFGGDGGNITVMGVSAGAHSIGHHMLNPQRLPIRKCILESGSPTARTILHAAHARTAANVAALKSNLTPQMASKPLHSLKVDGILDAAVLVWAQHMNALTWPFQPVIDGDGGVVPDLPLKLWEGKTFGTGEGELAAVMTGFCSHEGADFIPKRPAPFSKFFSTLIPNLTSSDIQALEALYPESGYTNQAQRLGEAYGHFAYICPVLHTAHAASQKPGAKVYLYEFAALTSAATRSAAHASHGETLTRAVSTKWPGLRGVSQAMHQRWTSFIASPDGIVSNNSEAGDAASTENTVWPAFETPFGEGAAGKGELLVFGDGNDEMIGGRNQGTPVKTRVLTEREKEVCRFWWDRMELSQGNGEKGVVKKTW